MISFASRHNDGKRRPIGHESMSESNHTLNSASSIQLVVGLVVATGSHAGVTAEIKEGIYMIGRDRECQIRPKSQSVSDRHCLVQHQSAVVRVFDLDSDEGTFVNDQSIAPKTWTLLNHGDRLRCGRYCFEVIIHLREDSAASLRDVAMLDASESAPGEHVDNRIQHVANVSSDEEVTELDETTYEDDFEFENLDEAQLPSRASEPQPETASPHSNGVAKAAKSRIPLPKPKISYRSSSRVSGFSIDLGGPDAWKMWIACIAMIATIGYVGWTVYQLKNGSQTKIIRGID
jgi:pSer/pThr/pTyr-binding forkhead associated (FHA) protein